MAFNTNTTGSSATATNVSRVVTVSGSVASPIVITAAGGITTGGYPAQLIFIKSNGGPVLITATPNISAGSTVGQQLFIYGTSDADDVGLTTGNGVICNGTLDFRSNTNCSFIWNGTVWVQTASFGL